MDKNRQFNQTLFDNNKDRLAELRQEINELKRKALSGQSVGCQLSALTGEAKRLKEEQGKLRKRLGYKSNKKKHRRR